MRVLFLDDMKVRRDRFQQNHIGQIVDMAKTADEAAKLMSDHVYDVAYLDHDLDEKSTMGLPTTEKTGDDVVKYIIEELPEHKRPKKIIVHSMNRDGARRMVLTLRDAGIRAYWRMWNMST